MSAASIVREFQAAGGSTYSTIQKYDSGVYAPVDEAWIASAEGQVALKASRGDLPIIVVMLKVVPLISAIASPFALLLGIAAMRISHGIQIVPRVGMQSST